MTNFLATIMLFVTMSLWARADPADIFPDTPENRTLVRETYGQYIAIDKNQGHFIDVNGIRMHYLEWGDNNGTPLIWSHGYSSTAFEMITVGQRLADAGYHVYAISYRGHGKTQITDYNFSLDDIADDIAAMMNKLGIEKAVIGGLSLGGSVATTFYEYYPERTLGLILEDGGADAVQARTEKTFDHLKELMAEMPILANPVFKDRFAAFQYVSYFYIPGWGGKIPEGVAPMFQSWVVEKADGTFKAHHDGVRLWGEDSPDMIDPARGYKLPLLHQSWRRVNPYITYRKLSVPMVIINPAGDEFDATEDYEKLRDMHPELITLVNYPDTPHMAHPMRPDWFVRDLTALLHRLKK